MIRQIRYFQAVVRNNSFLLLERKNRRASGRKRRSGFERSAEGIFR